ncbi:MAG: hypothetical protein V8R40_06730 [Dysosmobacter sp.]
MIVGTPVWAGRCSSIVRAFFKEHGRELKNVAYVATRGSEGKFEERLPADGPLYQPPACGGGFPAVRLRGLRFWQEEFLRQVRALEESL